MKLIFSLLIVQSLIVFSCSKAKPGQEGINNPSTTTIEKGIVKGRIVDSQGNPIVNANVVVENTVYYASYVYAKSDNNGYYKTAVPTGSWQVSVQTERNYQQQLYKFDLHPDNAAPFAGSDGAVRNFVWKLNGAKPGGGYYGSNVAVYPEPGSAIFMDDVVLTLTPDGPLADGSAGLPISKGLTDIGGGEDGINDVPLGKYIITARKKLTGESLQIRMRNTGSYAGSVIAIFTPGFTGSTNYQIVVQVK